MAISENSPLQQTLFVLLNALQKYTVITWTQSLTEYNQVLIAWFRLQWW